MVRNPLVLVPFFEFVFSAIALPTFLENGPIHHPAARWIGRGSWKAQRVALVLAESEELWRRPRRCLDALGRGNRIAHMEAHTPWSSPNGSNLLGASVLCGPYGVAGEEHAEDVHFLRLKKNGERTSRSSSFAWWRGFSSCHSSYREWRKRKQPSTGKTLTGLPFWLFRHWTRFSRSRENIEYYPFKMKLDISVSSFPLFMTRKWFLVPWLNSFSVCLFALKRKVFERISDFATAPFVNRPCLDTSKFVWALSTPSLESGRCRIKWLCLASDQVSPLRQKVLFALNLNCSQDGEVCCTLQAKVLTQ